MPSTTGVPLPGDGHRWERTGQSLWVRFGAGASVECIEWRNLTTGALHTFQASFDPRRLSGTLPAEEPSL